MEIYNREKMMRLEGVESIKESNKTENIGNSQRESRLLAGVFSEITRKGVWHDRKEQQKITDRVKKVQKWI